MSESQSDHYPPFAGRDDLLAKVHTQLMNSPHEPLVILGRKHIGKSAFLQHFAQQATYHLPVLISLDEMVIDDEAHFWVIVSEHILNAVIERGFNVASAPMADEDTNARAWFANAFLPIIFKALRQRHLIILFDDAHQFIHIIQQEKLPEDLPKALQTLCQPHLQMVFAYDIHYEDVLPDILPFITNKHQFRLGNLSEKACESLLQQWLSSIDEEAIGAVYLATGGTPQLIQRYGNALTALSPNTIRQSDIKAVTNAIYAQSQADFLAIWKKLGNEEQLVLTAIADLFYDDPLRPITTTSIATWSVKSDYLLDETAINAATRSLVYGELIRLSGGQISIVGELFRRWLLEHARISGDMAGARANIPIISMIGIGAGILMIVMLLLIINSQNSGDITNNIIPTLTIAP